MRILLTTDMYKPAINGVVTSTAALKSALEKRGHDVRVLTLGKHSRIDWEEKTYYLSSLGVEKIYPGARFALKSDQDYITHIIDWGPNVIHSQTEFSTFHMAKTLAKYLDIPMVHTYHTLYEDYTHYFSPSEVVGKKFVRTMTRLILNTVQAVIAPTQKTGDLLADYAVNTPISVIPTGIDLEPFLPHATDASTQSMLRQNYHIPDDVRVLLYVGRLGKEKNVQEILHYLADLDTDIDYRFVIVGDGPYHDKLQELVSHYALEDHVIFTGMIDNDKVSDYYKLGDVFTSASTSETQGLTYIEAFASRTPALCRHDEVLSHVLQNGITGFQYTQESDFASYFEQLMLDDKLRNTMADNAQSLAVTNYSSASFASAVEDVYKTAINNWTANTNH